MDSTKPLTLHHLSFLSSLANVDFQRSIEAKELLRNLQKMTWSKVSSNRPNIPRHIRKEHQMIKTGLVLSPMYSSWSYGMSPIYKHLKLIIFIDYSLIIHMISCITNNCVSNWATQASKKHCKVNMPEIIGSTNYYKASNCRYPTEKYCFDPSHWCRYDASTERPNNLTDDVQKSFQ